MMHVAASLLSFPPARWIGSEMSTAVLLESLASRGHTVSAVVGERRHRSRWEHSGVTVVQRREWRRIGRPDVVVCHADSPAFGSFMARYTKARLAAVCHNGAQATVTAVRKTRFAETFVVADWLRGHLGLPAAPLVRPFVDVDVDQVDGDSVTLVGMSEDKGGAVFWRLAESMPDVPFLGVKGGYGEQLAGPPLGNVTVLPHMEPGRMDVDVWPRTRVLLMPSAHESWGRVAVEACARGVPVVAHPTPGLLESLGGAGTFVDRDDVDGWRAAIRRLSDRRRWKAASRRAVAHAKSLDLSTDVERFCDAIEELGRR